MSPVDDSHINWTCPWCGAVADLPTTHNVICYSRTCACGSIGLAAPRWDADEIVDDAINIFGIGDIVLTEFNADRLRALQQSGVDVREGAPSVTRDDARVDTLVLWFRRGVT